jgi:predicted nucleic acid-binding protein
MASVPTTNPPRLVIDANVLIALCAKEADKYAIADSELTRYAQAGYEFFAPGVIIAESLFVLCKKLQDSLLTAVDHADAIADLCSFMGVINPPPNGDRSLVSRAEQVRASYGCSRSADGLYVALAEELGAMGTAELLTFRLRHAESDQGECSIGEYPLAGTLDSGSIDDPSLIDSQPISAAALMKLIGTAADLSARG